MKWPTTVPVLTAADMCHGFSQKGQKRCLLGWMGAVFYSEFTPRWYRIRKAIIGGSGSIIALNDKSTLKQNAARWNRAMRALGYTEIA